MLTNVELSIRADIFCYYINMNVGFRSFGDIWLKDERTTSNHERINDLFG